MKSIPGEDLQRLCNAHWEYVEHVIRNEYISETAYPQGTAFDIDTYCTRVEFHYKTAMAHGFKHGVQWIEMQILTQ